MIADDGDNHDPCYCEEILVFNCETEANNVRETFEELSNGEREKTVFWNFDVLSFNKLVNLSLCNVKLTDITFIRCCFVLKSVNVSFNKIRDISPVEALTEMVHLDISHNKVIDLSPLKSLTQLQLLRFHKNNVQCIECLRSMTLLSELWMSNNEISWTEFLHFSNLVNLTHIVMENNVCEEKPKYLEFLLAICPSVLTVNGLPAINSMSKGSQLDNKNWYNPSDFLKTTGGRIMLTQAKALLNESQREYLSAKKIGDSSVRRNLLLENTNFESPTKQQGRRGSLDSNNLALSQEQGGTNIQSQFRSTRSEGGDPIKYYKAKRQKNPPKKYVQEYDSQLGQSMEHVQLQQHGHGLEKKHGSELSSHTMDEALKSALDVEKNRAQLIQAPVTLIRFGETSSAAVAVSLHEDGTGYARWSHNGSVACSYENNRLFGQYRNGAIAAVVDPGGNGTVMNPRGKCVLNLRVTASADGNAGTIAEVLSDTDGAVMHVYEKTNIEELQKDVNANTEQQVHEWKFQNMVIAFDPAAWDLRVTVTNSRSISCFSSVCGGKLVEEITGNKKDKKSRVGVGGGGGGKSGSSGGSGGTVLTTDGHECMRTGLASVMSTLDDMLDGMKKK